MSEIFHYLFYQPILNLMVFIVALLPGHSLGWAIIIITVLIKLALYSTSLLTIKNTQKIQKLQPELQRIQKLYKNDRQRQTEEIVKLYRENKVNPYGGCLPLIIQLIVLIALYSVLRSNWHRLPEADLYNFTPRPERVEVSFYGYNLIERPALNWPLLTSAWIYIFIAVVGAYLQFYQTKMLLPKKAIDDSQTAMNRNMLYLGPALTLWVGLTLMPALPLYWLISSIFSIAQQYWFIYRGHIDLEEPKYKTAPSIEKPTFKEENNALPEFEPKEKIETKGGVTIKIRKKA